MAIKFKERLATIIKLLAEPKVLRALLSLRHEGYLLETGWFNSFNSNEPVDNKSQPIPWFTYPAIDFLSERLDKYMNVFEFGSGNSTIFFANRVQNIISVEHNKEWFEKIKLLMTHNSKISYVESNSSDLYIESLKINNRKFDIIIIDGIFRNECLVESVNHLTERGLVLLDDSERTDYREGINFILSNKFKRLDFYGIAPGILFKKCTTIFYKLGNILEI
jgi:hypothetical protein